MVLEIRFKEILIAYITSTRPPNLTLGHGRYTPLVPGLRLREKQLRKIVDNFLGFLTNYFINHINQRKIYDRKRGHSVTEANKNTNM